jgi:leukotriene-A4 hydrolase
MLDLDQQTQSNYTQVATEHVAFNWSIDFETQVLAGSAIHRMNVLIDDVHEAM